MRPLSLKLRVTLLTVAIIAIVIVVISAVAYHELEESLVRVPDQELIGVIATARSSIGEWATQPTQDNLKDAITRTPSANGIDLLVWFEGEESTFVSAHQAKDASAWVAGLHRTKRPDPEKERLLVLRHGGKLYRAAWFRHRLGSNTLSVLAITSVSYAQHEMEEFLRMLLILGVSMLLAAGILAGVSVLWSMRPIRATAVRLDGVTHQNLGIEHLEGITTPVELESFVESVRAMLARVNEGVQSQKRFVAEASHELRTPLALAKSTIQASRLKARTNEQYQRTLDELLADVDRLNHLVEQLLDLARLEEADQNAFEEVAVSPMLRSLADRYMVAGGSIICDLSDALLTIRGNPTELESLFGNLIDNAVKHGPTGGTITLRAAAGDGECLVTVHDEGGHIPADQIERLFDRFYRVDASRSRATGGSGLGLAIAKQITTRHGGDIWIASSPAEGTTVTVRLPLTHLA